MEPSGAPLSDDFVSSCFIDALASSAFREADVSLAGAGEAMSTADGLFGDSLMGSTWMSAAACSQHYEPTPLASPFGLSAEFAAYSTFAPSFGLSSEAPLPSGAPAMSLGDRSPVPSLAARSSSAADSSSGTPAPAWADTPDWPTDSVVRQLKAEPMDTSAANSRGAASKRAAAAAARKAHAPASASPPAPARKSANNKNARARSRAGGRASQASPPARDDETSSSSRTPQPARKRKRPLSDDISDSDDEDGSGGAKGDRLGQITKAEIRELVAKGLPAYLLKDNLSKEDERELKRQRRLIRNRESAHNSRRRRKDHIDSLEAQLETLRAENSSLRQHVAELETRTAVTQNELDTLHARMKLAASVVESRYPSLSGLTAAATGTHSSVRAASVCLMVMLFSFGLFFHGADGPQLAPALTLAGALQDSALDRIPSAAGERAYMGRVLQSLGAAATAAASATGAATAAASAAASQSTPHARAFAAALAAARAPTVRDEFGPSSRTDATAAAAASLTHVRAPQPAALTALLPGARLPATAAAFAAADDCNTAADAADAAASAPRKLVDISCGSSHAAAPISLFVERAHALGSSAAALHALVASADGSSAAGAPAHIEFTLAPQGPASAFDEPFALRLCCQVVNATLVPLVF